ncbi:hypothetical protein PVAND_015252 [Polypedilum vanderplanki]|uniref:Uncharacterized protein n=1 Tax=Polypedilum vanderplanki TaxID=319348 RepID=A0A9J6BCH5_POLVA|nr:hypothetical protein PVAND_015252 [Polypedilum vanderplanki]
MRKPLPQTIDDLYFKNFTIITVGLDNIKRHIKDMIDEERRPPIRYFKNPYYFTKFYLANKDNFTAKYAFLMLKILY